MYKTKTCASCCANQDLHRLQSREDQDQDLHQLPCLSRPRRSPGKRGGEKNCHVSTASCAVCPSLRTRRREETVTSVQPRVAVLSAVCCCAVCRCSCCHMHVPHLVVSLHVLCPEIQSMSGLVCVRLCSPCCSAFLT